MRKITIVLLFMLCLSAVIAGYIYGQQVPFSEQWPLFEALRTTSAIIFAVVGAWLAIVYPERLRLSLNSQNELGQNHYPNNINIRTLLSPAVNSTFILCAVLLTGIIAPLLKRAAFVSMYLGECRGATYALLVALTLWQTWTVILTLVPTDLIMSNTEHENTRNRVLNGMRRTSINRNE
ncbi:MAG: hypothetical protein WAW61_02400 [Methylococcaceae bacterium]